MRRGWLELCAVLTNTLGEVIRAQDEECVYDTDEIIMQIGVDLQMISNAVMC